MKIRLISYITIILWVMAGAGAAGAVTLGDSLSLAERLATEAAPAVATRAAIIDANPGAMPLRQQYQLSEFVVAGLDQHGYTPTVQEGTGYRGLDITAKSYMPLSRGAVAWGHAGFQTLKRHQVRWCEAADYSLLAPYVMGDSVGGDMQRRQYAFGGGYGARAGAWTWGASADYRASVDYRDRDPRIRATVSDLNIAIGATRTVSPQYRVGLSAGIRVYNQDCDLDFYSPIASTYVYALTGLGTYYPRFSGLGDRAMAYSALGAVASAQLLTQGTKGLNIGGEYQYYDMRQILRDYNNLQLTSLQVHHAVARLQWRQPVGNDFEVSPQLAGTFRRRIGTENIFGTAVSNTYQKIGSSTNYFDDYVTAAAAVPVLYRALPRWQLSATPAVRYGYSRQFYSDPRRDVVIDSWRPTLAVAAQYAPSRRVWFQLDASGGWQHSRATRLSLGTLSQTSALGIVTRQAIDAMSANQTMAAASLAIYCTVARDIALSIAANYAYHHWQALGSRNTPSISVAAHF